jgi:hypothetical protein
MAIGNDCGSIDSCKQALISLKHANAFMYQTQNTLVEIYKDFAISNMWIILGQLPVLFCFAKRLSVNNNNFIERNHGGGEMK